MFDRVETKLKAKECIREEIGAYFGGSFLLALLGGAIGWIAGAIAGWIPFIGVVISFFVSAFALGPIRMGICNYSLKLSRHQDHSLNDFFSGFTNFGSNLVMGAWTNLWYMLWSLIIIIPSSLILTSAILSGSVAAIRFSGNTFLDAFAIMSVFTVPFMIIILLATILMAIKEYQYGQVAYIKTEYPIMEAKETLDISKLLMKGHLAERLVLDLSFFGWALLVCITFGLAGIYVVPYMQTTYAFYYQSLVERAIQSGIVAEVDGKLISC